MKYEVLEMERQFLMNDISTAELSILQRNSTTRLKEKVDSNTLLYHSSNEQNEVLRMVVFALLVKLYRSYNLRNQRTINQLKEIVYHSPLSPKITTQQGIEPLQLFKYFATKINELTITLDVDQAICNLMNTEVFFEEVIFVALKKKIRTYLEQLKSSQTEALGQLIKDEFGLTLKILGYSDKNFEEEQDELILYQYNNHLHKVCPIRKERQSSESSVSKENVSRVENLSPISYKEESIRMDNSGNPAELSPLLYSGRKRQLGSEQKNVREFIPFSGQKKKRRSQKQKRGIFQMFCCCE